MAASVKRDVGLMSRPCLSTSSSVTPVPGNNVIQKILSLLTILTWLVSIVICTVAAGHVGMTTNTLPGNKGDHNSIHSRTTNISTGRLIMNTSNTPTHDSRYATWTYASRPDTYASQATLVHEPFRTTRRKHILKLIAFLITDSAIFKKLNSQNISQEMILKSLDDALSERSSTRMENIFNMYASNKLEHYNSNEHLAIVTGNYLSTASMHHLQNRNSPSFGVSYREGRGKWNPTSSDINSSILYLKRGWRKRFKTLSRFNRDSLRFQSKSMAYNEEIRPKLLKPENTFQRKRKRRSNSMESSRKARMFVSPEDLHLTQTLHFVDKLQTNPEPCNIPGMRIIILKSHKFRPEQFFPVFGEEVKRTVQIANTINDLLLYTKSPPETFLDIFFAMTQSLVEATPLVTGCAIAFNLVSTTSPSFSPPSSQSSPPPRSSQPANKPQSLFPYSYRMRDGSVVVTDLSRLYKPQTTSWFSFHMNKSAEGLLKSRNRTFANKTDIGNLTSFNARWNKTVSVTAEDGFWATPYYDCLLRSWVIQYSVPFYQLKGQTAEFKGVVLLEANFEAIQINQCAEDGSLFSNTHRCKRASTECKNTPSSGFRVGSYQCACKDGYHFPNPTAADRFFHGRTVENSFLDYIRNITSNYTTEFNCLLMTTPSSNPTPQSVEAEPIVAFDILVRGIPLGIQSFCMTVSVVIGTVIVCLRKTKVMRSSIWILLEMLLFGAILLYATVVVQYFEPTTTTCLLLPWFREVGFAVVYGVLVLKIYRMLAEFQSRKAHRVHVRDKDLLKYLAVILTVVTAYMSAWTAVNMDHLDNNSTILERLHTKDDQLAYTLCRSMWWDYVVEAGELIFLCVGMYMCYCVRSAPIDYSEGRFITGAICYEAVMSAIFYVLRHLWWYEMHPDHLFLMFFLRCQLTVTVVLIIILGPKLWFAHRPPDEDHCRSRAYSQSDVQDSSSPETMKLNVGISSNGDVEVGEISLTEMDPEDIRAELKRLYTQLQIYKTKTMRKDNPHISKRRGGRKQTHRRFSLQAFHHKHRHQHDHEHEHEMSKTPEESTNSAEAMAFSIEPSVKEDPNEGRQVPSVTFKSGHK